MSSRQPPTQSDGRYDALVARFLEAYDDWYKDGWAGKFTALARELRSGADRAATAPREVDHPTAEAAGLEPSEGHT